MISKLSIQESNKILREMAKEHGFHTRGKAHFRVIGDGVLQVIKFEYENRAIIDHILYVGLFSMYSKLLPRWFTSGGCIPQYGVYRFIGKNDIGCNPDGSEQLFVNKALTREDQLQVLSEYVFDILDEITTQKVLVKSMCQLDCVTHGISWNDYLKFSPFLHCGELHNAEKVMTAIIKQHKLADEANRNHHIQFSEEYYERSKREDIELERELDLAQSRDMNRIKEYLQSHYDANMLNTKFCRHP